MKRELKRGLRAGAGDNDLQLARKAALELLERSFTLRQDRLAIRRLVAAVQIGADVPSAHLRHCAEAALRLADENLHELLRQALAQSHLVEEKVQ